MNRKELSRKDQRRLRRDKNIYAESLRFYKAGKEKPKTYYKRQKKVLLDDEG